MQHNPTIVKLNKISSRNSIIVFILTCITFAAIDIPVIYPWLNEVRGRGLFMFLIAFLVVTFTWVAVSAVYDVIGTYIHTSISRKLIQGDEELQNTLRQEGMDVVSFIEQNKKSQLQLAVMRVLRFWKETPIAVIAQLVCWAIVKLFM